MNPSTFPHGFLWGTATAAHQVEGAVGAGGAKAGLTVAMSQREAVDGVATVDNFEWTFGYGPTIGLIGVDRATQHRMVKPRSRRLSEAARHNGSRGLALS